MYYINGNIRYNEISNDIELYMDGQWITMQTDTDWHKQEESEDQYRQPFRKLSRKIPPQEPKSYKDVTTKLKQY